MRTVQTLRAAGSAVAIMAHRPSAIAAVNKLMVLDGGEIKMLGDKADVLESLVKSSAAGGPEKPTLVRTSKAKLDTPRAPQAAQGTAP